MRTTTMLTGMLVAIGLASVTAQEPMTVRGEIVELSCYTRDGVAKATGAAHVACAKECVAKGEALAILTDGDGLLKITGDLAANKYAKLVPHIGQQVELTGTPDRYLDYSRAIKATTLKPIASK